MGGTRTASARAPALAPLGGADGVPPSDASLADGTAGASGGFDVDAGGGAEDEAAGEGAGAADAGAVGAAVVAAAAGTGGGVTFGEFVTGTLVTGTLVAGKPVAGVVAAGAAAAWSCTGALCDPCAVGSFAITRSYECSCSSAVATRARTDDPGRASAYSRRVRCVTRGDVSAASRPTICSRGAAMAFTITGRALGADVVNVAATSATGTLPTGTAGLSLTATGAGALETAEPDTGVLDTTAVLNGAINIRRPAVVALAAAAAITNTTAATDNARPNPEPADRRSSRAPYIDDRQPTRARYSYSCESIPARWRCGLSCGD